MAGNKPFLLKPAYKDYLWGGNRLNDDFAKDIDSKPLAETWECSTHPEGQSIVTETGEKLGDLLTRHPEYLGTHPLYTTGGKPELPILIKLIDAKEDLSVQVHPDDYYAFINENSLGKTEMWYVLDAKKDAEIVYGFNQDMDEEMIRSSLDRGNINQFLNHIKIKKDDLYYIEAGTIHAIGKGALLAEIQESSNLTYRLYDYDRVDKNGKKRELHIDKAIDVVNMKSSLVPRQPMRVLKYKNGSASEMLCRCKYFMVNRLLLNTEINRTLNDFQTDSNSFQVLLCVDGCGVMYGEDMMLPFFKGDCIFVPADSISLKLHGKAQFLNVRC